MRSQIPDHINVMLKQPEINPGRIVVVEFAKSVFLQQLLDFAHSAGEQKRVVHHDLQVFPGGQVDQLFGLRRVAGKGLLNEDMFAVFQGGLG